MYDISRLIALQFVQQSDVFCVVSLQLLGPEFTDLLTWSSVSLAFPLISFTPAGKESVTHVFVRKACLEILIEPPTDRQLFSRIVNEFTECDGLT